MHAPPAADLKQKKLLAELRAMRDGVAWPTLFLCAFVLFTYAITSTLAISGNLSPWVAIAINATLVYLAYTPLHEACHGNIFAKESLAHERITRLVGWLASAPMLHNFTLHRTTHLSHHRHLNDAELDADHWVNGHNALATMLRFATVILSHYAKGLTINRSTAAGRKAIRRGLAENAVWLAIMAGLAIAGFGKGVVLFMVLPAALGQLILAFVFDWLVHYPYDGDSRYTTTRSYIPRNPVMAMLLNFLTCGQNLHLMHHLYPWIPFYRYAHASEFAEQSLLANGASIVRI